MKVVNQTGSPCIYNTTKIEGPYGPLFLVLAEDSLASLTRGFASKNSSAKSSWLHITQFKDDLN